MDPLKNEQDYLMYDDLTDKSVIVTFIQMEGDAGIFMKGGYGLRVDRIHERPDLLFIEIDHT